MEGIDPAALKTFAAAIAIGIGGIAPALAIGKIGASAMESLGRNPESRSAVQANMVLPLAFAEAIAIYALVVALVILFVA